MEIKIPAKIDERVKLPCGCVLEWNDYYGVVAYDMSKCNDSIEHKKCEQIVLKQFDDLKEMEIKNENI